MEAIIVNEDYQFLSEKNLGGMRVQIALKETQERLIEHVKYISLQIGERNFLNPDKLEQTAKYIQQILKGYRYRPTIEEFSYQGQSFKNVLLEIDSRKEYDLVIGAHYDTVIASPGADDNASGVASLLELAHLLKGRKLPFNLRLAFFANEEFPFFSTAGMGSMVYARRLKLERRRLIGMLSLESVGYFSWEENSQHYPPGVGLFYPSRGNFLAIVGNMKSRRFGRKVSALIREAGLLAVEHLFIWPHLIPEISLSDNYSFWQFGFPALMLTDTAFLRNPNYHQKTDTYQTLDYSLLSKLVYSLFYTIFGGLTS